MSDCDAILRQGLHDELNITSVESYRSIVNSLDSAKNVEQFVLDASHSREKAQIAATILGFLDVSGAWQRETLRQRFEQYRGTFEKSFGADLASERSIKVFNRVVNKSIVDAWLQCRLNDQNPFRVFYTRTSERTICLVFRYIPKNGWHPDQVKVATVDTDNLSEIKLAAPTIALGAAVSGEFKKDSVLQKFQTYLWKFEMLDDEKNASLSFTLRPDGQFNLTIPGRPKKRTRFVAAQSEKFNIWQTRQKNDQGRMYMVREITPAGDLLVTARHENGQREIFHYVPTPPGYRVSSASRRNLCEGERHYSEFVATVLQGTSGNNPDERTYSPGTNGSVASVRGQLVDRWTAYEGPPSGGCMDDLGAWIQGYEIEYERINEDEKP